MGEEYDDRGFRAPQLGMDSRHDLVSHQSGYDDFWKALADRVWRHPRLGTAIILGIMAGVAYVR